MTRTRKNIYCTDKQVERLASMRRAENLSEAEIVRRTLDAYLAWNDLMYQPTLPRHHTRNAHSSPP